MSALDEWKDVRAVLRARFDQLLAELDARGLGEWGRQELDRIRPDWRTRTGLTEDMKE